MVCIYCGNETRVINSRPQKRLNRVWRRRICIGCGTVFTSTEAVDLTGSVTVRDKKQLEPFQRDKLFMSIYDSLKHRKTAQEDATALTDTVISKLYLLMHEALIEKPSIAVVTTDVLKRFDKVAATYYLAFHPLS